MVRLLIIVLACTAVAIILTGCASAPPKWEAYRVTGTTLPELVVD